MNNKGSVLVLLIIVIAIVSALGASLLNIVFTNYDIKKFNTNSKEAFYLSENGLNVSYVNACNLIQEAIEDSLDKANLHLLEFPLDEELAKNIFYTNYRQFICANIIASINTNGNPAVEVRNSGSLIFVGNSLTVFVRSSYIHNDSIEKLTWVDLIIRVPGYDDVEGSGYDVKDYVEFANWKS